MVELADAHSRAAIRRGEIWWIDLPEPEGSEPGYRRPALVLQANEFNQSSIGTVIVALLTSNLRHADAPGNVRVASGESGLPRDSVVNVSQVYTVDREDLDSETGRLSSRTMRKVEEGLRLILGL